MAPQSSSSAASAVSKSLRSSRAAALSAHLSAARAAASSASSRAFFSSRAFSTYVSTAAHSYECEGESGLEGGVTSHWGWHPSRRRSLRLGEELRMAEAAFRTRWRRTS